MKTHFVRGVEFVTEGTKAYTFNNIDDADMMLELLVCLGFVSAIVDSIII